MKLTEDQIKAMIQEAYHRGYKDAMDRAISKIKDFSWSLNVSSESVLCHEQSIDNTTMGNSALSTDQNGLGEKLES